MSDRLLRTMNPSQRVKFMQAVNKIVRSATDTTEQRQQLFAMGLTPYEADALQREQWNGEKGYITSFIEREKQAAMRLQRPRKTRYAQRGR